jgi:hypothetical protein
MISHFQTFLPALLLSYELVAPNRGSDLGSISLPLFYWSIFGDTLRAI